MFTPQPPASRPIHPAGFLARMPAGGTAYVKPDDGQKAQASDDGLRRVAIWVCQRCLDGEQGECHTPGCLQWLRGGDERLDFEHRYEVVADPSPSSPDRETEIRQAIEAASWSELGDLDEDMREVYVGRLVDALAARESALLAELDAAKQWAAERERVIDTLREERERWEQRAHECNTERAKANGERDALQARIDAAQELLDEAESDARNSIWITLSEVVAIRAALEGRDGDE